MTTATITRPKSVNPTELEQKVKDMYQKVALDPHGGSGRDPFVAALHVGRAGRVVGVDMTDPQLAKAERLRAVAGFENVSYLKGYIEGVRCEDGAFDAVISHGVIHLAPDTQQGVNEAARLLRPGGRLAIAD